jgi:serine/threonine protein kinase
VTSPAQTPAARDRTGQRLGPYRVLRLLGAGGMGRVYLADDTPRPAQVALKVLNDDVLGNGSARLRFLREAQTAAAVLHPSVATVFAIHAADDCVFIAMELVEGRTLRSFLEARRGPLELREALRIARDVAHALCHAHAAGVVHRDLKPENLMLDLKGQVKILDFGLAKHTGPAEAADVEHASTLVFATADGVILGTPSYMAPEQIHGLATDARADIFSLGVVLYEMATGARPFRGASTMEVLIATARDEQSPASENNPQVPPALDACSRAASPRPPRTASPTPSPSPPPSTSCCSPRSRSSSTAPSPAPPAATSARSCRPASSAAATRVLRPARRRHPRRGRRRPPRA